MDGVLVDHAGGLAKLIKKFPPEVVNHKRHMHDAYTSSEFWENLGWLKGGSQLWNASKELFNNVNILSSAGPGGNRQLKMESVYG